MKDYKYKRPEGKYYRISIKEWNKVFGCRGRWPFVRVDAYITEDKIVTEYTLSTFGKCFMWTLSPVHYIVMSFMDGFPDAHKGFIRCVFDKKLGAFGSDVTYRVRKGEVSSGWKKLMKLIGEDI